MLPGDTLAKLKKNEISKLTENDFYRLKSLTHNNGKMFIMTIQQLLRKIKKKNDLQNFTILMENLKNEITDISPFISDEVYRLTRLMIENKYYLMVLEYSELICDCGDRKMVSLLKRMIALKGVDKVIEGVGIYRMKKMILEMTEKSESPDSKSKKDNHIELAPMHIQWTDSYSINSEV